MNNDIAIETTTDVASASTDVRTRRAPSEPLKTGTVIWRTLITSLCDVALGAGGAALLWFGGGATIADGSIVSYIVFVLAFSVLLVFRHLASDRRGIAVATVAEVRTDQIVTVCDLVLLVAATGAWMLTDNYFFGWVAVFSAIASLLGTTLQLMLDVVSGRNSDAQRRAGSLLGRRVSALETFRIVLGVTALAVIVLGAEIHEWNPSILNLTVLLVATSMGIAALVSAARNRR